jgi:hypothetical protein
LEQQEKDYPLRKGSLKDQKQFKALIIALEEKVQTSWLKEFFKPLKAILKINQKLTAKLPSRP